jgi:non-specific protein-tyrosine kinase
MTLEAFRALAVDLKFAGGPVGNGGLSSIAVTSSARGEGKTLTACNLALTRASHGVRTLLIDADMRASGVTGFFGMPTPKFGLSDLLAGSVELSDVSTSLWVDGRETLCVIPAGTPTPHSAELLDSPNMGKLLEQARGQFDLIVIDTPPLNAITDAATIAPIVDGVVLVVRGGVTDRAALEMTLERLARGNGRVLGVVLNDVRLPEGYISRYHYPEAARA